MSADAVVTFGSFLQASVPGRARLRRRLAVMLSAATHAAVLAGFVAFRGAERAVAPQVREPIFLRLAPPKTAPVASKAAVVEPTPRPVRKAPRPAPIVQPPPEIPPPEPTEEPVRKAADEEPEEDAGVPEPTAMASAPAQGRVGGLARGTGDAVLELKDVARAPTVLEQVKPDYPREARWERVEGLVVLRVIIGLDGRIERASTKVVRSVPQLDAAAIAAIAQWRFTPAIDHSGRVVRVAIEVPVRFTLR